MQPVYYFERCSIAKEDVLLMMRLLVALVDVGAVEGDVAGLASGQPYTLHVGIAQFAAKVRVAQCLQRAGFMQIAGSADRSDVWITKRGLNQLREGRILQGVPAEALRRRDGIAITDCSVFELWLMLEEEGWTQLEWKGRVIPAVYCVGDEKRWYTRAGAKTIHQTYLVALATAPTHGRPVEHLQPSGYYTALLEGKEYKRQESAARQKKIRLCLDINTFEPEAKRPRRERRRRAPIEAIEDDHDADRVLAEAQSDSEEANSDEGDESGDSAGEAGEDGEDVAPVEEDDRDGGSDRRIDSTSGSNTDSDEPGGDDEGPPPGGGGGDGGGGAPRAPRRRGPPVAEIWGCFRISPIRKAGQFLGWQMTCKHPNHPAIRGNTWCTKSRHCDVEDPDASDLTRRFLKWWALEGLNLRSKEAHQEVACERDELVLLPEEAELDAMVPGDYPVLEPEPVVSPAEETEDGSGTDSSDSSD